VKRIALTHGKFALVDAGDYSRVVGFSWYVVKKRRGGSLYARAYLGGGRKAPIVKYLHSFILKTTRTVDHINGNGLDNRSKNLRVVDRCQNQWNRVRNPPSGVRFDKRHKCWTAGVTARGKTVYAGKTFKTKLAARRAFLTLKRKHHAV